MKGFRDKARDFPSLYDHRENGEAKQLIRTIIEQLRANPKILRNRQNKLLQRQDNHKNGMVRHCLRKTIKVTTVLVKLLKYLKASDYVRTVQLEKLEEFLRDGDSTMFMCNKSNTGYLAEKRRGVVKAEREHNIALSRITKTE